MTDMRSLSAAQIILLATELCTQAGFEDFQALQRQCPDILGAELCCRILLTFVSGNEPPDQYVPLLKQLRGLVVDDLTTKTIDASGVEELSDAGARRRIRRMRLENLKSSEFENPGADDVVARFVVQQAYRIDAETGDLPAILNLIEPFIDGTEYLRRWLISHLLPLIRLDYEYYSDGGSGLSLEAFQKLGTIEGLDLLLQRARIGDGKPYIGRDLRGIVGPWMYGARSAKRRKLSHSFRRAGKDNNSTSEDSAWQDVNEWILKTSVDDYDLASRAIYQWDGPKDIDIGGYEGPSQPSTEDTTLSMKYAQTALATVYATDQTSPEAIRNSWRILERVADIADVGLPRQSDSENLPICSAQPDSIIQMLRSDLRLDSLLEPQHPLTWPSSDSLKFLWATLTSLRILKDVLHYQQNISCRDATNLGLFTTEQVQRKELHKTLQNFARVTSVETDWHSVRRKTLWLSRWGGDEMSQSDEGICRSLFWRLSNEDVETEIFSAMLTAKQYNTALALYLSNTKSNPLPSFLIEKVVEHEILNAYDNASNGNKTRGGLKRASEILKAFGPHFPPSSPVNKIEHLIAATHSFSFYHLTLQHGVPFQPVSIRVHQDPISLISKVLEQNSKAYTKLDDLLSIGRGFVAAGLPTSAVEEKDEPMSPSPEEDMESKMLESDHRITYDAIISALSSNDFDTAYSYILTRLSPSSQPSNTPTPVDDTSWRAAYAAGRHPSPSSISPSEQITTLSKRMELLSLAMTLVPDPSTLPSMLSTWQSCENELNTFRAQESAEEKAWDDRGDNISSLPGGFGLEDRAVDIAETQRERERRRTVKVGRRPDEDEAPMGLFDVARGAARAIGKSAFPLRGPAGGAQAVGIAEKSPASRVEPSRSSEEYPRSAAGSGDEAQQQNRVRKRDMVSNMVTGGLVSGLGWVLGAQPVDQDSAGHGKDTSDGE
jgi:protein transport protein SEC39